MGWTAAAAAAGANEAGEPEWAAWVAIDWADQKHVWRGSPRRESGELAATPEAVKIWAAELVQRFTGRPVAVALEQARGPLVWMLSKYAHVVLFPIHPSMMKQFRSALCPSGAKDDPSDADLLLDLLIYHRRRLRPLHPDTVETRRLQFLVEDRRRFVGEKTACSNRLADRLKVYFPQAVVRRWGCAPG